MPYSCALYGGLGDRHQQNGTNYTLDLNAGLTQVLSDGTNTYLYGNGRIAQAGSTTEYFLGDALGSVRQLVDATSAVTLTKSYAPYGGVTQAVGTSQTNYGFTNESTDPNGLVYLRARYYAPTDGRFTSRDTWGGDYNRPLSLNRWGYVEGNPVNLVDPTGQFPCEYCEYLPVLLQRFCMKNCCGDDDADNAIKVYVGDFNLSSYYTLSETDNAWSSGTQLLEATHPNSSGSQKKYLSKYGYGYTDQVSEAQSANSDFLDHVDGVCMEGSGVLADGRTILCSTSEERFEWDLNNKLTQFRAYETIAKCGRSSLLAKGDMIYVDAPWFNSLLDTKGNSSGYLEVNDNGYAPGLCNSNGHEGIDLYVGSIQQNSLDFQVIDSVHERPTPYWPLYKVIGAK
ncbi:hypothetical protein DRQ26_01765 [bacterium]|nr:MAG: hypothetical protein DRQ26_01765 [bacterium]